MVGFLVYFGHVFAGQSVVEGGMANLVCGAIIFGVAFVSAFYEFPDDPMKSRMALMAVTVWFATLVRQILLRRQGRHLDSGGD